MYVYGAMTKELDQENPPVAATRRGFIKTFAMALGAGMAGGGALVVEPQWLEVSEHTVPIPGLPSNLEGLTIAQISDLHFHGFATVHGEIEKSLKAKRPEILALTGDAVDDIEYIGPWKEYLESIRGICPESFACLGNWEGNTGMSPLRLTREYASHGVKLLINGEAVSKTGLRIFGASFGSSDKFFNWVIQKSGYKKGTRLLLSHAPAVIDYFPPGNGAWDLALAGHTHGGQVNLGPYMPWLPPACGRFVAGMYHTASGPAYVSRGVGNAIFDLRFNCRPELAYFTLARG